MLTYRWQWIQAWFLFVDGWLQMAIGPGQFMIREACHTCMLRKQRGQLQTGGLVEIPRNSTYQSCFSLRATLYMYFYNYNYSYIYIPPSSEVCKISDPNEKNAPLAPWGAKKCPGPEIRSWSELDAIYCWRVAFQRKYGPGCHTKINHFKLYEFLYLGHPKSEEIHMNFVTWDVPKVSHFI